MRLLNPTMWAVAGWLFFVACIISFSGAPAWCLDIALAGMVVSALVSLVAGIVQRRRHPKASRAWQYLLIPLLIVLVLLFMPPCLGGQLAED